MYYKLVSVLFVDSGASFWQILLWNMYWNLEQLWESKALIGMPVLHIYIFK